MSNDIDTEVSASKTDFQASIAVERSVSLRAIGAAKASLFWIHSLSILTCTQVPDMLAGRMGDLTPSILGLASSGRNSTPMSRLQRTVAPGLERGSAAVVEWDSMNN